MRRCTWIVSLALAVFVIVSGQVRALDTPAADAQGDDVTYSVLDDAFLALPVASVLETIHAPTAAFHFPTVPPPGRLVDSELFRPPAFPST